MTHVTCSRLTAKNQDQLQNPTLGGWVWALPFTYTHITHVYSKLCSLLLVLKKHKALTPTNVSCHLFFVHKCHCQTADRRGLLLYALCQDTVASFVCMTVYLNITLGTLTSVVPSLLVSCLLCYYVRSLYCSEFFSTYEWHCIYDWLICYYKLSASYIEPFLVDWTVWERAVVFKMVCDGGVHCCNCSMYYSM